MFRSFLWYFLTVSLLYVIWVPTSSANNSITTGFVYSAKTLEPLDSVRVACFSKEFITHSNANGSFSLSGIIITDIQRKPYIIDKNSGFPERISSLGSQDHQFFNTMGRRVKPVPLNIQSQVSNPRTRSPGIYILKRAHHSPQKVLITNRTFLVPKVRKTENKSPLRSSRYPSPSILSFYKQGYETAFIPTTEIDSTFTVFLNKKRWVASDLHFHSVLSDGKLTLDNLAEYAFNDGDLDVLMSTEHGGRWARDTSGRYFSRHRIVDPDYPRFSKLDSIPLWYTLTKYSWPKVLGQRKLYPDKIILQGFEWNCPGNDHIGIGFIKDEDMPDAIAQFEYRFDRKDRDNSRPEWVKNNKTDADALIALKWLYDNYPRTSFCFINHPTRYPLYDFPINEIRDMIATAPGICLGFEGAPGHQNRGFKSFRGNYLFQNKTNNARTYGGADPMLTEIGGKWDALLSEGHRFWTIANSDFHYKPMDFLPGEYTKTWSVVTDTGTQAWLEGMRNGEIFFVHGNLISALDFYIDDGYSVAFMGDELSTKIENLTLVIRFKSDYVNQNGNQASVDHIDLITGIITGKVSPSDSEEYRNPKANSTRFHSRFSSDSWIMENGWYTIRCQINVEQPSYFRLRGTNLALNTPGELDEMGNPLPDPRHSEKAAWQDLWFYSNPIFVYPED